MGGCPERTWVLTTPSVTSTGNYIAKKWSNTILVIVSHMKLNPINGLICLFQKIKDPNKTATIPTIYQIIL